MPENTFQKTDDLPTVIAKMTGQRDAKMRWGYTRQARQANFMLGILHFQQKLEATIDESTEPE